MKLKRTIKVEQLEFSEYVSILNLPTLEALSQLQEPDDFLLETEQDIFLLKGLLAFRFLKPSAKPQIFHVKEMVVNPDFTGMKVSISAKELLAYALRDRLPIFETESEYIIPSSTLTLVAKKEGAK